MNEIKNIIFFLIKMWQKTGPLRLVLFNTSCRFYPSCSDYCKEAVKTRGLLPGIMLTVKRLFRCHPFCKGGIDEISQPHGF